MKYSDTCEHCGHIVTAYSHSLNAQLVDALSKLCDRWYQIQKAFKLTEIDLSHNQINNFQKLQYFGLVHRSEYGWMPTVKGASFVRGKTVCYNMVATFGKEILENDHIAWSSSKRKPKLIHIGAVKNYKWKPKVDYQLEKARAASESLSLF